MRFVRKLLSAAPVVVAVALAACQTAGPAAKTGATAVNRPAAQTGTQRPPFESGKTDVVMGVAY